jgi:hypothetical protein
MQGWSVTYARALGTVMDRKDRDVMAGGLARVHHQTLQGATPIVYVLICYSEWHKKWHK